MAATDPDYDDLAVTPEQVVAREARVRPRVGLVALAAAICTVGANLAQNAVFANAPRVTPVDALRDAAGEPLGRPGLASDRAIFLKDHAAGFIGATLLQVLVYVAFGIVLLELLRMTLDRAGRVARPTRLIIWLGVTLASVGTLAKVIGVVVNATNFANGSDHGTAAAHDVTSSGTVLIGGTLIGELGSFALAAAIVLVSLAAMRVGLLTRFVGVLGAIVGVLQILGPLSAFSFIVSAFWLAMVGALMLGRWPSGLPPAWERGEAVPWPTQQEIREQREAARAGRNRERGRAPVPEPAVTGPTAASPSPATSARKKRKRRG